MKKTLRLTVMSCLLAMSGMLTANAQQAPAMKGLTPVCTYTVGDAMGAVSNITKVEPVFFDGTNSPCRSAQYGAGTGSTFAPAYYYTFTTTELDGTVTVDKTSQQWGKYNFGDFAYKASTNKAEKRTYDAQGRLIQLTSTSYAYNYEYDANGFLVKEIWTIASNGNLSKTIEYTNNAKGQAEIAIETNASGTFSYKYLSEYDEEGNLICKKTFKRSTVSDEKTEYLYILEDYIYKDGMLTEYVKYNNGKAGQDPKLYSKKTYEIYDGNSNKIIEKSYTYSSTTEVWNGSATAYIYEYTELSDAAYADAKVTDLKAEMASNEENDVKVSFTAPASANEKTRFAILRSGHIAADKAYGEIFDAASGKCVFIEENVPLSTWEYFVIAYEGDFLNNITKNAQRYMSNISTLKVESDILRAVNNLGVTVSTADYEGTTVYVINLTWDAPVYNEKFVSNEVYRERFVKGTASHMLMSAEPITDPEQNYCDFDYPIGYETSNFFVVSHFTAGTTVSEMITVNRDDLAGLATGIDNVAEKAFCISNGMLTVSGKADIKVYNAAGQLVGKADNADNVALNGNDDVNIVVVKSGKSTKVYKIMK